MFQIAAALLLAPLLALADPTPTEPSGASVFREGGTCSIKWDADPTRQWTTMNIELMTGSNLGMIHLRTIATVDGTDTTNTTFEYPCLAVEPNSKIYFYQFSSPSSNDLLWTTRFTIADAQGNTTPPTDEETTPDGEIVEWGTGTLENAALIDDPPAFGTDVTSSSGTSAIEESTSSRPTGTGVTTPTQSLTRTRSTSSRTTGSETSTATNSSQDGAAASFARPQSISGLAVLAIAALGGAAFF